MPTDSAVTPPIDALRLARSCRTSIMAAGYQVTSCIESTYLFERTAHHLGLVVERVVCQATAMTPLLAQAVSEGRDARPLMDEPGYWAVGVGLLQYEGDYVGRIELDKNRFVGHVVCIADGMLVDLSVDQMNRPERGLRLNDPLIAECGEGPIAVGVNEHGATVRYVLHADVAVPLPRSIKKLDRMARGLANQLSGRQTRG